MEEDRQEVATHGSSSNLAAFTCPPQWRPVSNTLGLEFPRRYMSRISILVVFLCGFLPGAAVWGKAQRDRAVSEDESFHAREGQVAGLLGIIRDESLREKDPKRVSADFAKLGEMKATEAIPDLVRLLEFRVYEPWEKDPTLEPSDRLRTSARKYPAIGALVGIGEPALPALVRAVETSHPASLEGKCALEAIRMMYPDEIGRAIRYLEGVAAREQPSDGRDRLRASAARLKNIKAYKPPP